MKLNNQFYNQYCSVDNSENQLEFEPYRINTYRFCFNAERSDIGKELEVSLAHLLFWNQEKNSISNDLYILILDSSQAWLFFGVKYFQ